ncbi:MAG: Nif3-like dinuclear metal center hexameric protein [Promethearchaeota archaeon]
MYLDHLIRTLKTLSPESFDTSENQSGLKFGRKTDTSDIIIRRCIVAVDLSFNCLEHAIKTKTNLIIVHHSIFPRQFMQLFELLFEKFRILTENRLWIYVLGDSWISANEGISDSVCQVLDLEIKKHFYITNNDNQAVPIGRICNLKSSKDLQALINLIKEKMKITNIKFCGRRYDKIENILIIGGQIGNDFSIKEVVKNKIDTMIIGETTHEIRVLLYDLGINTIELSHYNTDIIGMNKLKFLLSLKHPNIKFELFEEEQIDFFD